MSIFPGALIKSRVGTKSDVIRCGNDCRSYNANNCSLLSSRCRQGSARLNISERLHRKYTPDSRLEREPFQRKRNNRRAKPSAADYVTIAVEPSPSAGKVTAHSSDGRTFTTTTTPLLASARYWQELGAPSSASIVTVWSSGSSAWSRAGELFQDSRCQIALNRTLGPMKVNCSN
jgi:hypothetical protein